MRGVRLALLLSCAWCATACWTAPTAAAWRELFDGETLGAWRSTEFGGEGAVAVRDRRIEIEMGSPLSGITWGGTPLPADFELEVTAARTLGSDFFCGLTFPIAGHHLTLVLGGWGGAVCGLSSLDGLDAAHNATRTLRSFVLGRNYTVRIRVEHSTVVATLDGEPLCRIDTAGHRLSLRPEVMLSRPLGIASFATAAAIREVRWRPLTAP